MIRMQGVCKRYPSPKGDDLEVLCGVDLHLPPGSYTAFVGPSGSGKSTLMHILGCLDTPTSGQYWLDGQDVSRMDALSLSRVRRDRIGFVFQGYQLMARMTAAENVAFPLMLRGMGERERMERACRALRQVELQGREYHRPCELSGGQQQRVAMARAICTQPKLLLCDEPTGALDPESRNIILDLLDEWHQDGHTIVMITHDPFVASRAVHRCRVENGRVISAR